MIVRCPECKREFNLELDDVVVELNFTCPNCGKEFKVRNVDSKNLAPADIPLSGIQSQKQTQPLPNPKSARGLRIATLIAFVIFLLSLIFWIVQQRSAQQVPVNQESVLSDSLFMGLVANWDEMHKYKSFDDVVKCPYAETVTFYGMTMRGCQAAKKKQELLDTKRDYQQESVNVMVTKLSADSVRCEFEKHTSSGGKKKMHPSCYLVFVRENGGNWKIAVESDAVTDENLKKNK